MVFSAHKTFLLKVFPHRIQFFLLMSVPSHLKEMLFVACKESGNPHLRHLGVVPGAKMAKSGLCLYPLEQFQDASPVRIVWQVNFDAKMIDMLERELKLQIGI